MARSRSHDYDLDGPPILQLRNNQDIRGPLYSPFPLQSLLLGWGVHLEHNSFRHYQQSSEEAPVGKVGSDLQALGLYWGYMGIMEKKMETTIIYNGLYRV